VTGDGYFTLAAQAAHVMPTLTIDDELMERIESHLEEGETPEEFVAELVAMYETEGAFLQEGYSE